MKKMAMILVTLMLVIYCSAAFAYGRVGSSSSYASRPIYVHVKAYPFELKEYPWNDSYSIAKCTKDHDLRAFAKYHDKGNDIFWIKVEYPQGSGQLGWAGEWRFDISDDELEDLPYEWF